MSVLTIHTPCYDTEQNYWKSIITSRLQQRNRTQSYCFQDLINTRKSEKLVLVEKREEMEGKVFR